LEVFSEVNILHATTITYKSTMPSVKSMKNRSLLGEVWAFLRAKKAWWLIPVIALLVLVGILIIVGQSSAVSPFIYALF